MRSFTFACLCTYAHQDAALSTYDFACINWSQQRTIEIHCFQYEYYVGYIQSLDSVASIRVVTTFEAGRFGGSIAERGKKYLFPQKSRRTLGLTASPTQRVPVAFYPGVKRPVSEVDHCQGTEVVELYLSFPYAYAFMASTVTAFPLH